MKHFDWKHPKIIVATSRNLQHLKLTYEIIWFHMCNNRRQWLQHLFLQKFKKMYATNQITFCNNSRECMQHLNGKEDATNQKHHCNKKYILPQHLSPWTWRKGVDAVAAENGDGALRGIFFEAGKSRRGFDRVARTRKLVGQWVRLGIQTGATHMMQSCQTSSEHTRTRKRIQVG